MQSSVFTPIIIMSDFRTHTTYRIQNTMLCLIFSSPVCLGLQLIKKLCCNFFHWLTWISQPELLLCSLQLEKIIGKVKSGKYGSRIIEEISNRSESENLDPEIDEEHENKAAKKAKTKKTRVLIECSEDDE